MKKVWEITKEVREATYEIEWEDILKLMGSNEFDEYTIAIGDSRYNTSIFPIKVYAESAKKTE
jgi:hypothetical protein